MKPTITGKRFSRRSTVTFHSGMTSQECAEASKAASLQGGWVTFDDIVLGWSEIAISILKKKNLPPACYVYYIPGAEQWQIDPPVDNERPMDSGYIENYITKVRGKEHDSIEGLAAKLLNIAAMMNLNTSFDLHLLAYEFGETATLLNTYLTESNQNKGNAKSKGQKKWALKLAEHLVNKDPSLKFTKCWEKIPEDNELLHCYRLNKEGKKYLCYSKFGEKDGEMPYDTFRTEYIYPEINKHKKK